VLLAVLISAALAGAVVAAIVVPRRDDADARPGSGESGAPTPSTSTYVPVTRLRVAAIGDSLTLHDDNPAEGQLNNSWFAQVLRADASLEYTYNAGIAGNRTDQMRDRVAGDVLVHDPDLVFVLGGVNDLANGVPVADILANLRDVVRQIRESGARVVIGTTTPWNQNPRPSRLVELNAGIRALAAELGLTLVDFHAATVGADGRWLPDTTRDGLHPNQAGAELMAQAALAALQRSQITP
jgi:lysophospholipase L1-like esterase